MDAPKTLQQAIVYFSDPDRCFQYALKLRWQDGVVACPRCGSERHAFIKTRRIWECYGCKKQFSLKVGTIFEDSALGLDKWMMAMWMIAACKNGASSYEIHRAIGVTQKSAWFMLHRIRKAMQDGSMMKLGGGGGEVEADESFIGGKSRNMHKHVRARKITKTGGADKAMVFGILERGGKVRTMVLPDRQKHTVHPVVKEHVHAGAALFTDAMLGYRGLDVDTCTGSSTTRLPMSTDASTPMAWRISGACSSALWVEPTLVSNRSIFFRYLDEQSFRYNNRKGMNDQARFEKVMGNVADKRLTYKALIGAGSATSH
jgi:transposase-like protein